MKKRDLLTVGQKLMLFEREAGVNIESTKLHRTIQINLNQLQETTSGWLKDYPRHPKTEEYTQKRSLLEPGEEVSLDALEKEYSKVISRNSKMEQQWELFLDQDTDFNLLKLKPHEIPEKLNAKQTELIFDIIKNDA